MWLLPGFVIAYGLYGKTVLNRYLPPFQSSIQIFSAGGICTVKMAVIVYILLESSGIFLQLELLSGSLMLTHVIYLETDQRHSFQTKKN